MSETSVPNSGSPVEPPHGPGSGEGTIRYGRRKTDRPPGGAEAESSSIEQMVAPGRVRFAEAPLDAGSSQGASSVVQWMCLAGAGLWLATLPREESVRLFQSSSYVLLGLVIVLTTASLLVAGVLAYAMYRLTKRSGIAGGATFCTLMALLAVMGFAASGTAPTDGAATRLARLGVPLSAPTDGKGSPSREGATPSVVVTMDPATGKLRSAAGGASSQDVDAGQQALETSQDDIEEPSRPLHEVLSEVFQDTSVRLRPLTSDHRDAFAPLAVRLRPMSEKLLDERITHVRRALQANRVLDNAYLDAPARLAKQLRTAGFPDQTASEVARIAFPDDRLTRISDLRHVQGQWAAALEEEARVLKSTWGQWQWDPQTLAISFKNPGDAERYTKVQQTLAALTSEQREMIRAMRTQVADALSPQEIEQRMIDR